MLELLRSGEEHNIFRTRVVLADNKERAILEQAEDIFDWLQANGKLEERAEILRVVIFPAVLSDMLHFIYEALDCSQKAKLNVSFALLRKPLQENLFILESIASDPLRFAEQLSTDPRCLRATKLGGAGVHAQLIDGLLKRIEGEDMFNAKYIAQLRYEKCKDGFDGICNLAMHLITEHPKIRTDVLNFNFIFSGWDEKAKQWAFLYSRLPYVMAYMREVVEHVCERIALTDPNYLEDLKLRIAANVVLWWEMVSEEYRTDELEKFALAQKQSLMHYYEKRGKRIPSKSKLESVAINGPR